MNMNMNMKAKNWILKLALNVSKTSISNFISRISHESIIFCVQIPFTCLKKSPYTILFHSLHKSFVFTYFDIRNVMKSKPWSAILYAHTSCQTFSVAHYHWYFGLCKRELFLIFSIIFIALLNKIRPKCHYQVHYHHR